MAIDLKKMKEKLGLFRDPNGSKYTRYPSYQEGKGKLPKIKNGLTAVGFTSGVGSMLIGARQAGFTVLGNVEWRDYYRMVDDEGKNTFIENFPGAFFARGLVDLPDDDLERIEGATIALGHPECLPGETKIYTSKGWKPIKTLKVGDRVLTHKKRFKKVVKLFSHSLNKGDTKIELRMGSSKKLRAARVLNLTAEHPVLTQRGWVAAGKVKPGDLMQVLAHECTHCGKSTPFFHPYCSTSCGSLAQWERAGVKDRKQLLQGAHSKTRDLVAKGKHHFTDPFVRRNAMLANRSVNEEVMEWALTKIGLPPPERQTPVLKFFADLAYPEHKIVIECDGGNWHRSKDDPTRDALFEKEGWTVIRFSGKQIQKQALKCAEEVQRVLANHNGEYQFTSIEVEAIREYASQRQDKVYNLGVEEDESYVAKGYVVHNCGMYSLLNSANKNSREQKKDAGDIPLFIEYVQKLRPKYFVMDDLPQSFVAFPMSEYHRMLPDYDLFPEWISNYNYGNPQKFRRRMFMIGSLKSEKYTFEPGEKEEWENWTVQARIEDIEGKYGSIANHDQHTTKGYSSRFINMRKRGDRPDWGEVQKYFKKHQKPGQNFVYHGPNGPKVRPSLIRMKYDYPSPVLTGGNPMMHPNLCLPLSVRERARIQGFPDDFVFYGTRLDEKGAWEHNNHNMWMVKQTGKAMPIEFNAYAAAHIAAHIQKKPSPATHQRFLKSDPHISDAKTWFCDNVGYSDQASACSSCWLHSTCTLTAKVGGAMVPLDVEDMMR